MKTRQQNSIEARAFTLIECLAYIAIFFVVLALAWGAYRQCLDSSRYLQRAASDITLALNAGERWREDVRNSSGFSCATNSLVLKQSSGNVEYVLLSNAVFRCSRTNKVRVISSVKNSQMLQDAYGATTALRWELELEVTRTNTSLKPLFTFKAVPGAKP